MPPSKAAPVLAPRPFQVMLDFATGSLTPCTGAFERRLSDMAGAYEDQDVVAGMLSAGQDPVIYRGYDADVPHAPDHLPFRTTIIRPGVIGSEFFMTKGHHHRRDTAEVYVGMSGFGLMIMETRAGDVASVELTPSAAVYVPPGWAHRTVNTADEPLVFLATYPGDAGHDYESIERGGFSHRVHRRKGGYDLRPAAPAARETRECR
jgi:glucose-6-phosphate isomerase, archaeal